MTHISRTKRRILHTADLHLESLNDKTFYYFKVLMNLIIKTKPDLMIIAGDLFDHNRVDDNFVKFVVDQLQHLSLQVVVLPGNHDCLIPDSVYIKDNQLWENADNIRVLIKSEGETLFLPDLGISIWGKPITTHDGNMRPLAGIPQHLLNGQWHIAIAHGYYVDTDPPAFPSFHITREEIVTSGRDYIALGHMPIFKCICTEPVPAFYCGAPSVSKTAIIVDLADDSGVQVTCHSLERVSCIQNEGQKDEY